MLSARIPTLLCNLALLTSSRRSMAQTAEPDVPGYGPETCRRAFLNALAGGESEPQGEAGKGYDILCGGGRFRGFERFPKWSGVEGPAGISHAAGRYQFEPATWNEQQVRLKLPDFSPNSQDVAAWDLAQRVYQRMTRRNLLADLQHGTVGHLIGALQSTWTSVDRAFLHRLVDQLHQPSAGG